jgi:Domain of unknown function (DUF4331)
MKKMTWIGSALALTSMLGASSALAADHLDGPAVKAVGAVPEDITDLFTWVDGNNTVLILNTYPGAVAATQFSNTLQYVFHTSSAMAYGAPTPTPLNIIATFDTAQNISVWVGTTDYVSGNASTAAGLTSASGNVKVFAGLVDDPFFFNLGGFQDAEADVESAASGLAFGADKCPALSATISADLEADISGSNHGVGPAVDFFAPVTGGYSGNVLSIVLSIKTSLLTSGGPIVGVWASTNMGS